jgi:AP-2 complex subunit alpha
MAILRLYRRHKGLISLNEYAQQIISLMDDQDLSVVLCASHVINAMAPEQPDLFKGCIPYAISKLNKVLIHS